MPVPSPVQSLLLPRSAALLELLPPARAGDAAAVHQARVASRRLREVLAAVRLLHPGEAADRARREGRRVTRALGAVRELDVSRELFDELAAAHELDEAARLAVQRALTGAHSAAIRAARVTLSRSRMSRLRRALEGLGEKARHTPAAKTSDVLAMRLARRGAQLQRAVQQAGTIYVPARLHDVRIAVKRLRYALEVSGEATQARVTARLRQLKAIQDLLGRAHDLHVFEERLRLVQAQVVRTSRRTAREVGRLARVIDQSCRELHASFMSRRSALAAMGAALAPSAQARRASSAA